MNRMPTVVAEKVYDVLMKFAEASQNHYEKETFIYHYGVLTGKSNNYTLNCMDDAKRVFTFTSDGKMWITGTNSSRVNSILRKISSDLHESIKSSN